MTTGPKFFVDYHLASGKHVRLDATPSAKTKDEIQEFIEDIVRRGDGVVKIPGAFIFLSQVTHITIHEVEEK